MNNMQEQRSSPEVAHLEQVWLACIEQNPRQQRKLCNALLTDSPEERRMTLAQQDVEPPFAEERRILLRGFRQGGLDHSFEDITLPEILSLIPSNIPALRVGSTIDAEQVPMDVIKTILTRSTGRTFLELVQRVTSVNRAAPTVMFGEFLTACSTPIKYFEVVQGYLADIAQEHPELLSTKASEAHAIQSLLYGKQSEYWDQYQLLQRRAFSHESAPHVASPRIERASQDEVVEILMHSSVHSNEVEHPLTITELQEQGVRPEFKITVDGQSYFFSTPFLAVERDAVIGYTPDPDQPGHFQARSFYLSLSQNVWRLLPRVSRDAHGKLTGFFKATDETWLDLAIPLQQALGDILTQIPPLSLDPSTAERLFCGTSYSNRNVHGVELPSPKNDGSRTSGVERKGRDFIQGSFGAERRDNRIQQQTNELPSPETLTVFDGSEAPDFTKPIQSWISNNRLYGDITSTVFASKNSRLLYVFCEDALRRVWISHVENASDLTSFGGKMFPVETGALTTPAYEYMDQSGVYGNEDLTNGRYIDLSQRYLNEIKLIQEYIVHRDS